MDRFQRIRHLLIRSNLKKIIMIVNYNASAKRCFWDFLANIDEKYRQEVELQDLIEEFIGLFHSFLSLALFEILYLKTRNSFLGNINYQMEYGENILDFRYYRRGKGRKTEIKIGGRRWIFSTKVLTNDLSNWRTELALPANLVQSMDAKMIAFIINRVNCFTIHDSIGSSNYNIHLVMDAANEFFCRELGTSTYSPFILI